VPATVPTGSDPLLTLLVTGLRAEHAEELIVSLAAQSDDRWRAWLIAPDPAVAAALGRFASRVRSRIELTDRPPELPSGLLAELRGDDVPLAHFVESVLVAPGAPAAVLVPVVTQQVRPVRWGADPGWSPTGQPTAVGVPTGDQARSGGPGAELPGSAVELAPEVVLVVAAELVDGPAVDGPAVDGPAVDGPAGPDLSRHRFEAAVRRAERVAVLPEPAVLRRVWLPALAPPAGRPAVEHVPVAGPAHRRWRLPFAPSRRG